MKHKEWYSRGYLPHFNHVGVLQMISFHLADALPSEALKSFKQLLKSEPDSEKRKQMELYVDAGHGACHLKDSRIAQMVEDALLHFDIERYRLFAWVIMPNHVHVLVQFFEDHSLSEVVHSWKSFTALEANRILGIKGRFCLLIDIFGTKSILKMRCAIFMKIR